MELAEQSCANCGRGVVGGESWVGTEEFYCPLQVILISMRMAAMVWCSDWQPKCSTDCCAMEREAQPRPV